MQRTTRLLLLAALFLVGLALARQDNGEQPADGNGNANGNGNGPRHGGKGGHQPPSPDKICQRIAADCQRDGQQAAEGADHVGQLDDLCDSALCVPFLESHKCFLRCAGACHHDNKDDPEAAKTCAESCLTCEDGEEGSEEAPAEEAPAERKSMVSIIRNAARRQEETPADGNGNGNANGNGQQHHGGQGGHHGKGNGPHHGGPPAEKICEHIAQECAKDAPAERITKDELCDQETCVGWFQTHQQCFWKCAGGCKKDNAGDKDATDACLETCLDCEEDAPEEQPTERRYYNAIRLAVRRQDEEGGEQPTGEDGGPRPRGPRDPCEHIQKKCTPAERRHAAVFRRRQEEVTSFDQLCDEQVCHSYFETHKCAMGCLRKCHEENKEDVDGFKACADGCVTCTDPAPARRRAALRRRRANLHH